MPDKPLTPRQIAARKRFEAAQKKDQMSAPEDGEGYQIFEKYTGLLFRTYKDLDQAKAFVKKFPGYELRLNINNKKGNTTMGSDEAKKYKVLREFEDAGVSHGLDEVVEMLPENAAPFVEDGSLEEVVDGE